MAELPFHVTAKPVGPLCNLDCWYCFCLEREVLYPQASQCPTADNVLEFYIRQYKGER